MRRGHLQSVSRFKRKLLGSSLETSRENNDDKGAARVCGDRRWCAPLNREGSKDSPAKRSASPRAMLGVDGRA